MDRRLFIVALAGLSASSGLVFAQSSKMGTMGDEEKKHILETLQVGTMSLEASRLAVERAKEPMVKQFANFEVSEQETIGEILKPLAAGDPPLDPRQPVLMKKLESSGGNFEHDYVEAEIEGHNRLLQIQEAYLSVGRDQAQLNVAKLARGMIKEHLTLLAAIQKGGARG
jgi:putative membrane protein